LCIHRTQTWHLVLRLGLHEANSCISPPVICVCLLCLCCIYVLCMLFVFEMCGLCVCIVFVCWIYVFCVCLLCLCVLYVCCVCVYVFLSLRYPELQQTLSLYLVVSNVILMSVINTSNPVTGM